MTTIRYETPEHVLCDATDDGAIPFVAGGLQDDGTFLYKFDLDQHHEYQDAKGMLDYILRHLPPALAARLHIRRSNGGGYHIPIRTTRPLCAVKLSDPRNGVYAGEICDQRIEVDICTADDIPLLSYDEVRTLIYYLPAPGAMGEVRATDDGTPSAADTTRKARIREGLALIAGYRSIHTWRQQLDTLIAQKPMLATYRGKLRTSPDRSTAYGNFIQSLMLHAIPLGASTEERCAMVAAMAIGTGANGKEQDQDYRVERDTAAIIAKIIHGDRFETPNKDGTYRHWTTPAWVNGAKLPPAPPPEPTKRAAHRPAGDKDKQIARFKRILARRWEDDPTGKFFYFADDLDDWGARLGVKRRAIQGYLTQLEAQGQIRRGQESGRAGGRPWMIILGAFWDANNSSATAQTTAKPPPTRDAHATPAQRIRTPETANNTVQCIKVEEHQKPAHLPAADPDDWADYWAGAERAADDWKQSPEGRRMTWWDQQRDAWPVDEKVLAIGRGATLSESSPPTPPPPTPRGLAPGVRLVARAVGVQVLGAPLPAPAGAPSPSSSPTGEAMRQSLFAALRSLAQKGTECQTRE